MPSCGKNLLFLPCNGKNPRQAFCSKPRGNPRSLISASNPRGIERTLPMIGPAFPIGRCSRERLNPSKTPGLSHPSDHTRHPSQVSRANLDFINLKVSGQEFASIYFALGDDDPGFYRGRRVAWVLPFKKEDFHSISPFGPPRTSPVGADMIWWMVRGLGTLGLATKVILPPRHAH